MPMTTTQIYDLEAKMEETRKMWKAVAQEDILIEFPSETKAIVSGSELACLRLAYYRSKGSVSFSTTVGSWIYVAEY